MVSHFHQLDLIYIIFQHIEGFLSYAKLFRSGGRNDINSFLPPEVHWIINKLFEDAVFSDVFKSELNKFCDDNSR